MYTSYWRLKHRPFDSDCDPAFYYPAESHQAALLKLRYIVEHRQGGAVLAGPAGSGKTLLLGMLRTMLPEPFGPWIHLVYPQMPGEELLAWLAGQLGGHGPAETFSVAQSLRQIEEALQDNARRGRHAVLVIDEAHLLDDPATQETLRLLLNFQHEGHGCLTLLLAGQVRLLPLVDRAPPLEERLAVRCLLRPFNEAETAAYVAHRLRVAGCDRPLFDTEALSTLHRLSGGIARRINRLCDLALLIGFAEEQPAISSAHLEAISEELASVVPE